MKNTRVKQNNIRGFAPVPGRVRKGAANSGGNRFTSIVPQNTPAKGRQLGVPGTSRFGIISMDYGEKWIAGPSGAGVSNLVINRKEKALNGATIKKRGSMTLYPSRAKRTSVRRSMLMK